VRDVHEIALPDSANAHLLLIIYDATSLEEVGRLEAPVP
jgi:hypothetical protein